MSTVYQKIMIESNSLFHVYYGVGISRSKENQFNFHYDSDIALTFFKHCRGIIKIEGKHYPIQDGDVIITTPQEIHCCIIDEGSFNERISLTISKKILHIFPFEYDELFNCFYNRQNGEGNRIPAHITEQYSIGCLMETILQLSKKGNDKNRTFCTCKIIELLSKLNDITTIHESPVYDNSTVTNAIHYINEHFNSNITCAQIAEQVFISKSRLEHLFKESVGMSLWDYVILRRLMFFNEQIQQGSPIKEAALIAGFHNYSNFYRLYKKHMHITPLEYKKSSQT